MLVIQRYPEQETVITVPPSDKPTTIVLKIVDVRGNKVRLGWTAPPSVRINRREVEEAMAQQARDGAEAIERAAEEELQRLAHEDYR